MRSAEVAPERVPAEGRAPLVLLHPWGLNMLVWKDVAPVLAADRRVILIDLPGHGKSDKTAGPYPMRRLALAVLDVLDARGLDHVILMGNSLGGATSLAVALEAPERVDALVLISAPGGRPLPSPIRKAVHGLARPRALASLSDLSWTVGLGVVARGLDGALVRRMHEDILALRSAPDWLAWSRASLRVLASVVEFVPPVERILAPTLVVYGERDIVVWEQSVTELAERLPRAQLTRIEDCGHMPELECPDQLLEVVGPFLKADGRPALPSS